MNILIIGNSIAGISAAEEIRKSNKECLLTIISDEETLSYYRHKLIDYIFQEKPKEDFFLKLNNFYKDNGINLIFNKTVVGVDTRRKRVRLGDDSSLNFDKLLITAGAVNKFPDIKGTNKKNVVGLRKLADAEAVKNALILAKTVFLAGESAYLKDLAARLIEKGIEVFLVTKNKELSIESGGNDKLRLITDLDIAEIIGEGEVQAVKLSNGKVFACSLLIFGGIFEPNTKFIKDTPLVVEQGLIVDEFMRTNIAGIFAAGDIARLKTEINPQFNFARAESQGRLAAASILKE